MTAPEPAALPTTPRFVVRHRRAVWVLAFLIMAAIVGWLVWRALSYSDPDETQAATIAKLDAQLKVQDARIGDLSSALIREKEAVVANGGQPVTPPIEQIVGSSQGPTGATGEQGARGLTGVTGPAGPAGKDAACNSIPPMYCVGATGGIGPQGAPGATGPAGPAGPPGETVVGPAGPQGPAGESVVGPQGPGGPEGPAGPAGADGATGPPPASWTFTLLGATYLCSDPDRDGNGSCAPEPISPP